jgi:hypothetical protein
VIAVMASTHVPAVAERECCTRICPTDRSDFGARNRPDSENKKKIRAVNCRKNVRLRDASGFNEEAV